MGPLVGGAELDEETSPPVGADPADDPAAVQPDGTVNGVGEPAADRLGEPFRFTFAFLGRGGDDGGNSGLPFEEIFEAVGRH